MLWNPASHIGNLSHEYTMSFALSGDETGTFQADQVNAIAYDVLAPCNKISNNDIDNIDGLVQERHNAIANALELRLSCTNQSIWDK